MKKNDANQPGKKKSRKQKSLIALCCVLAVILVVLIAGTAYMERLFGLMNKTPDDGPMSADEYQQFLEDQRKETEEIDPDATVVDPGSILWEDVDRLEDSEEIINLLLIGQDRRPGEGRQRSDAMILCTINRKTNTLTLTSFMRDMYVQIPGYFDHRINACYQIGGMELLDACLEKNFGIHVDGNLEVDFNGFESIIEAMGGVEIKLTEAEANYINSRCGSELKEGSNLLNGQEALTYSRIRYIGNADFGRTNRQRTVLTALVNKCRDLSLTQLSGLVTSILPMLTTDMKNSQIMGYVLDLFPMLSNLTIETQRIPADGAYYNANIDNMSVLVPDLVKNRDILANSIGG